MLALMAFAPLVASKEIPKDTARAAELYDTGVMHERIMAEKEAEWSANSFRLNAEDGPQYPELHFAQCKDGKSIPFRDQNTTFFRCNNVSLAKSVTYLFKSATNIVADQSPPFPFAHRPRLRCREGELLLGLGQ